MTDSTQQREFDFPVGASISPAELDRDPYDVFERLRAREPVSWIKALSIWYIVKYKDVQVILKDTERFVTSSEHSLIYDTFGAHILTVEGAQHKAYKTVLRNPFAKSVVCRTMAEAIREHTDRLLDEIAPRGAVDFRPAFASRLPILTMLSLFGLPLEDEQDLRRWYNSFEHALANFERDKAVRIEAKRDVQAFHDLLQQRIEEFRTKPAPSLLSELANAPLEERMSDDEIKRNASIIFFGGISTVEALILNTLWALSLYPEIKQRVMADRTLLPQTIEESIRFCAPVQSATRHVTRDTEIAGLCFEEGDVINCMLGAANRDSDVFTNPDEFNIDRKNVRQHLGFAVGPHHCLGSHLARLEAEIALSRMFDRIPTWKALDLDEAHPRGYEFRQPKSMKLSWE